MDLLFTWGWGWGWGALPKVQGGVTGLRTEPGTKDTLSTCSGPAFGGTLSPWEAYSRGKDGLTQ